MPFGEQGILILLQSQPACRQLEMILKLSDNKTRTFSGWYFIVCDVTLKPWIVKILGNVNMSTKMRSGHKFYRPGLYFFNFDFGSQIRLMVPIRELLKWVK